MFKVIDTKTNLVIACYDKEKDAVNYANQQNGINAHIGDNAKYKVVGS